VIKAHKNKKKPRYLSAPGLFYLGFMARLLGMLSAALLCLVGGISDGGTLY